MRIFIRARTFESGRVPTPALVLIVWASMGFEFVGLGPVGLWKFPHKPFGKAIS